jgi:hypothetical protein
VEPAGISISGAMMSDHGQDDPKESPSHNGDDHSKHSVGQRIGEALILGLYLLIDAFEVWPRHPLLAAIAIPVGVLALLLLDGGFSKKRVAMATAVAGCLAVVAFFVVPKELPAETENHGTLIAAYDSAPSNGCASSNIPIPDNAILFVAGTNAAWTTSEGRSLVLKVGSTNALFVERNGSEISFDADIFDENGNLVVRIVKDKFTLISGQYSYRERSDDRSKLTVYDRKGNEMLFIDRANPKTVRIRGLFNTPDNFSVRITDEAVIALPNQIVLGGSCKGNFSGPFAGFSFAKRRIAF